MSIRWIVLLPVSGSCQDGMLVQVQLLQTETIHLRTALTRMRAEAMTYQQDIKKLQVMSHLPCPDPALCTVLELQSPQAAPQHSSCPITQSAGGLSVSAGCPMPKGLQLLYIWALGSMLSALRALQTERNLARHMLQEVKQCVAADVMASSQTLQELRATMLRDKSATEVSLCGRSSHTKVSQTSFYLPQCIHLPGVAIGPMFSKLLKSNFALDYVSGHVARRQDHYQAAG